MAEMRYPDIDYLHSRLVYNPITGDFTWKSIPSDDIRWNNRYAGKIAGSNVGLYRQLSAEGHRNYAHIYAYAMMTGSYPTKEIDHINGDKRDNRWRNLRLASHSQNNINKPIQRNNTSGHKGLIWESNRWGAYISIHKKWTRVGIFDCKQKAIAARLEAEKYHYGEFSFVGAK